jgi:hypothetical protein
VAGGVHGEGSGGDEGIPERGPLAPILHVVWVVDVLGYAKTPSW